MNNIFYYVVFTKDKKVPAVFDLINHIIIRRNDRETMAIVSSNQNICCSKLLNVKSITEEQAETLMNEWFLEEFD